ncbi:MAG: acyltransferase domain-containing protein [Solirubrobacterales bacterium]|nr:acyltransferase domain-containing protein [Solirubrobacterales bacterium]
MSESTYSAALLFPGQGSQTSDMRELVERHEPELARLVLDELGTDPFARADEGTRFAQPAIYCASIASWSGAGRPLPPYLAGHSLGELSALAAAGALDPADGVRLAITRGRLMGDVAGRTPGGMIALLGDGHEARAVAGATGLEIANDNGPTQVVAAGPLAALDAAAVEAKARKLRSIRLPIKGAFHTRAMEAAAEPFRAALAEATFAAPRTPVFSSTEASPFAADPETIRDRLAAALTHPVRWRETLLELHRLGVRRFVEAGPGKALTGMVRRSFDDVEAVVLDPRETVHV